jgi:hypothetical protein
MPVPLRQNTTNRPSEGNRHHHAAGTDHTHVAPSSPTSVWEAKAEALAEMDAVDRDAVFDSSSSSSRERGAAVSSSAAAAFAAEVATAEAWAERVPQDAVTRAMAALYDEPAPGAGAGAGDAGGDGPNGHGRSSLADDGSGVAAGGLGLPGGDSGSVARSRLLQEAEGGSAPRPSRLIRLARRAEEAGGAAYEKGDGQADGGGGGGDAVGAHRVGDGGTMTTSPGSTLCAEVKEGLKELPEEGAKQAVVGETGGTAAAAAAATAATVTSIYEAAEVMPAEVVEWLSQHELGMLTPTFREHELMCLRTIAGLQRDHIAALLRPVGQRVLLEQAVAQLRSERAAAAGAGSVTAAAAAESPECGEAAEASGVTAAATDTEQTEWPSSESPPTQLLAVSSPRRSDTALQPPSLPPQQRRHRRRPLADVLREIAQELELEGEGWSARQLVDGAAAELQIALAVGESLQAHARRLAAELGIDT